MNIKHIENILIEGGIEKNEAKIEAKMLLKHFLKLSDIDLTINPEFEEREALLQAAALRASKRIPIQHIIGKAYFMNEEFIVNQNVLIPRDETEILVRRIIQIIKENSFESVLDIGTGSGCIACMVAKLTQVQVLGVDISTEALHVALDNASKLNLFNKAIFRKSDVFSKVRESEKFDIIVSNPPYIPIAQKNSLEPELKFEPKGALFAQDESGVEFYERIIQEAPKFLNKGGYLAFELGINQSEKVFELMQKKGFQDIEIEKDLAYIDRIIWGKI